MIRAIVVVTVAAVHVCRNSMNAEDGSGVAAYANLRAAAYPAAMRLRARAGSVYSSAFTYFDRFSEQRVQRLHTMAATPVPGVTPR